MTSTMRARPWSSMWVRAPWSSSLGPDRERRGAHPPETGGITATSSPSCTGSSGSAGSPFTQMLEIATTWVNASPNRASAPAMTCRHVPTGQGDPRGARRLPGRSEKAEARHR